MAIEQELQAILEARYGRDVRQNIHDAIQTCYDEGRAGVIDHVARAELPFKADLENGQVKLSQIPQVALDNLVKVQTDADRFALTTAEVQIGDTVKVIETDLMYLVVDDTKLDSEDGYTGYSASVDWETISGRPEGVVGAQGVAPPVQITDPAPLYRADVIDSLTSTDTDKPLSANQGKVLNDALTNNEVLAKLLFDGKQISLGGTVITAEYAVGYINLPLCSNPNSVELKSCVIDGVTAISDATVYSITDGVLAITAPLFGQYPSGTFHATIVMHWD